MDLSNPGPEVPLSPIRSSPTAVSSSTDSPSSNQSTSTSSISIESILQRPSSETSRSNSSSDLLPHHQGPDIPLASPASSHSISAESRPLSGASSTVNPSPPTSGTPPVGAVGQAPAPAAPRVPAGALAAAAAAGNAPAAAPDIETGAGPVYMLPGGQGLSMFGMVFESNSSSFIRSRSIVERLH